VKKDIQHELIFSYAVGWFKLLATRSHNGEYCFACMTDIISALALIHEHFPACTVALLEKSKSHLTDPEELTLLQSTVDLLWTLVTPEQKAEAMTLTSRPRTGSPVDRFLMSGTVGHA
jgi:hypothetical protein